MERSQASRSLQHKFKILNISGLWQYRCYTKKLQTYLSGNPKKISKITQLPDVEESPYNANNRTFTRQSNRSFIKFFTANPRLSEKESCNQHSLCRSQSTKTRKEVSPQNILEYSYSGVKRICGECGLQVFELDFAFICSDCGQLIHKACTDICKRRHGCSICCGETNANQIYPFCQIYNLSELINGDEFGKRAFKVPTRLHAKKCFPVIKPLHITNVNPVSRKSLGSRKRRRQSKNTSENDMLLPRKRRKIEEVKHYANRNRQSRLRKRRNKKIPDASGNSLHAAGFIVDDSSYNELKTNWCTQERQRHTNERRIDQRAHTFLKENISLFVSKTMDFLGYGYEMIKFRQRMYHADDELTARFSTHPDTRVTTGGKGEGTTMYFENDADYLFVVKQLICTDYPQVFNNIKSITIFKTERNRTSPGYTRLELLKFSGRCRRDEIRTSLIESHTGSLYLSNEAFISSLQISQEKTCSLGGFIKGNRSGPSTPISDKYNSYDDVLGLPCCCPDLLEKWFARSRHNRWPPQEVLHAISLLDAHVVPVGFKGSSEQYLEWRICFSLAELHLMQILNECQIQTYVLLKKIAKTCLQPISKDITSYVIKNTVLWICEKTPSSFFQKKHVLHRLIDCVEFLRQRNTKEPSLFCQKKHVLHRLIDCVEILRQCIRKNYLPSYMISERNLIAGRLNRSQRYQLGNILGILKREEGNMFLRVEQIRDALLVMYKMPSKLREYGANINILERIVLMWNWIRESAWKPNMTKVERNRLAAKFKGYNVLERELDYILHVDVEKLQEKGWTFDEINDLWMERMHLLLS